VTLALPDTDVHTVAEDESVARAEREPVTLFDDTGVSDTHAVELGENDSEPLALPDPDDVTERLPVIENVREPEMVGVEEDVFDDDVDCVV
jgi:hypothetical protein